ncbi:MAG: hypothetical protein GY854_01995, partial [Deltaproteobacteria bacterium]|nr:hypothetical protein [Deltaproteobacteria bacterium]
PVHNGTDRIILNPSGETFGVYTEDKFHVYAANGTLLYELPRENPNQYFKLIPGSGKVLAAIMSTYSDGEEVSSPRGFKVIETDGTQSARISAPDLNTSRLSRNFFVYTSAKEIIKVGYDGVQAWSHQAALGKFKVPRAPVVDRIVAVPLAASNAKRRIVHLTSGVETHSRDVGEAIFEVAISPNGIHSAAITRRMVYIFHNAVLAAKIPISAYATASLDVNNLGEVLVGAKNSHEEGTIHLFRPDGAEVFDDTSGIDDNGFRPWVEFGPSGDDFVVVARQGVAFYEIAR